MSNLVRYAKEELRLLSGDEPDAMQKAMNEHIIGMVELFSKEGHSGFSAAYAANILDKLLRFLPLTPLAGTDDEWLEVSKDVWQNRRCSRVFKGADGRAYDIEGKIFRESNGNTYVGGGSRVYIEFPYTPKSEIVNRSEAA